MKMTKKLLRLVLAAILTAAMIVGCSSAATTTGTTAGTTAGTTEGTTAGSTEGTTAATETQATTTEALEPITYTIKSVSPGKDWELKDSPVGAEFVAKTGVNIKMEHSVGDENQTIALIIAGGDLPDAVAPHYIAAPFIDAGVALEVTDLIQENAPNYLKALGTKWPAMKWTKEDLGRYYLNGPEQYPESFEQRNWFFLQHAVVKDLGYPEMKTVAQFEQAIRDYKTKYPTIDDQPTIGLSLICDQWRWIISLTNPGFIATGTETSGELYVDPETLKVTYRETRDVEKGYYKWLNHMYNDGLLDKEAFTQTYDQYLAKVATGRVLALTDMGWEFGQAEATLRQDGKEERTYGCYPIVLEEGMKNASFVGNRSLGGTNAELIITTSMEQPERFIKYIDFLMSPEGQILTNWGLEGVHHDIVDGKRVFKPEEMAIRISDPDYSLKTGIGLAALGGYQDGVKGEDGQYYTVSSKEDIISKYTPVEKEVLDAYGKQTWADGFPMPEEFPLRPWPGEGGIVFQFPAESEAQIIYSKIQDIVKTDIIRAIMAKPEEFDATWDIFLADMDQAGVKTFEAACEDLMRDTLELWAMEG